MAAHVFKYVICFYSTFIAISLGTSVLLYITCFLQEGQIIFCFSCLQTRAEVNHSCMTATVRWSNLCLLSITSYKIICLFNWMGCNTGISPSCRVGVLIPSSTCWIALWIAHRPCSDYLLSLGWFLAESNADTLSNSEAASTNDPQSPPVLLHKAWNFPGKWKEAQQTLHWGTRKQITPVHSSSAIKTALLEMFHYCCEWIKTMSVIILFLFL